MANESTTIRIYKPTLIEEKPLPLDSAELAYAPKLLNASKNGLIPVQLEQDVVIQRISHDLYAKPESGFRELYNNEARACRIAAKQYNAKPRIEISLIPSERKLVIHGIDSLGISQEKFLTVYTVLGRSDNWDGKEVGMFGFGRASYSTLSDIMILETFSRETGEQYATLGKNGVGFNLLPQPDLKQPGTRITLTLRENIGLRSIIEAIVAVSRFSGVETYLNIEEDLGGDEYYQRDETIPDKAGRYQLGPERFKEYLVKRIKNEARSYWKVEELIPIEVDDESFYLYGVFTVRSGYDNIRQVEKPSNSSGEVYLVGTPIEASIDLPFSRWVLNIKDERKYQPTADRERLCDEAVEAISKKVDAKLKEVLAHLELRTLDDYLASGFKDIYKACDSLRLEKYLSQQTVNICRFTRITVKADGDRNNRTMGELLRYSRNLFYLPSLNIDKIALIRSKVPDAIAFKIPKRDFAYESVELMSRFGVRFGDEFIKQNRLRQKRRAATPLDEVVLHSAGLGWYSWGRFQNVRRHTERVSDYGFGETTTIIRIPERRMKPYLELLSTVRTSYRIVKDDARLQRGIPLQEFVEKKALKMVETSDGKMRFSDIANNSSKEVSLRLYSDPRLSKHLKSDSKLTVIEDADVLFELMVYLRYCNVSFEYDGSGSNAFRDFLGEKMYRSEFINDSGYEKIGDSEITYSIIHAEKEVQDEKLLNLFLNAARHSRDAEEISSMKNYVLELNKRLTEKVMVMAAVKQAS